MKKGIILALLLLFSASSQAGMTICNRFSCWDSYAHDAQEVMDALAQLFSGGKKELLFCMADNQTKTCYERPITFWGRTNVASVEFKVPFARIYQVQIENGAMQAVLDYQLQTNRYYPVCAASDSTLNFSVSGRGDFVLNSPGFKCQITELGETKMGMRFMLDYLDLERGRLGGTFEASAQGDVIGGGTGYALLQFSEQRAIELPRRVPESYTSETGYQVTANHLPDQLASHTRTPRPGEGQESKLVDWDWDGLKEKWDSFSKKFMKILYLEPVDD